MRHKTIKRRGSAGIGRSDPVSEGKVYLFTGSKSTGGFCVTRKGLLEPSKGF